jgi:hypothetical protein
MKFEHGLGTLIDPGADGPIMEIPTTQCVHCAAHFPLPSFANDAVSRANRIGRGFCMNCNGYICGEGCRECVPFERWLEQMEGTKNPTAVSVSVPAGIWIAGAK